MLSASGSVLFAVFETSFSPVRSKKIENVASGALRMDGKCHILFQKAAATWQRSVCVLCVNHAQKNPASGFVLALAVSRLRVTAYAVGLSLATEEARFCHCTLRDDTLWFGEKASFNDQVGEQPQRAAHVPFVRLRCSVSSGPRHWLSTTW